MAKETVLYLHADRLGQLWFLDGGRPPGRLGPVNEFIKNVRFKPAFDALFCADRVRLAGMLQNARLITELFDAVHNRRDMYRYSLEVCTPLVCPRMTDRNKPEVLLHRMSCMHLPGSLGGWHEVTFAERNSYSIYQPWAESDGIADKAGCDNLLMLHPAFPAVSFVSELDRVRLCQLLSIIIDPRWYVDPDNPDRPNKLFMYLGLDPKTVHGVLGDGPPNMRYHERCKAVLYSWCRAGKCEAPNRPLGPRDFLWRVWLDRGKGARGALRACQYFVEFIRAAWLDAVCRPELFVPRYFFKSDEADAFDYWMNNNVISPNPLA